MMYRFIVIVLFSSCLFACSGGGPSGSPDGVATPPPTNPPVDVPTKPPVDVPDPDPDPIENACLDTINVNAVVLSNGFGFNPANTRNQPSPIDSGNVANLVRKYELVSAGATERRGAPAVTAQTVYFSAANELLAVNRDSGCLYWAYQAENAGKGFRSASILLVNNIPGQGSVIFAGDYNGFVYAVNAQSGELLWKRFAGDNASDKSKANHFITGGMQYYDGQLFVPVSSKEVIANVLDIFNPCCSTHGLLVAFDAITGGKNWIFNTTDDATIFIDTYRNGPNGVPVWSTPAIDPARNAIYIGTGQNYTEPVTAYSDAILSLNMDTGLVNWVFQARNNDAWNASCGFPDELIEVSAGLFWNLYDRCPRPEGPDFDFGAAPVLADNGNALIAGDKGGNVYSLDPDNGGVNWTRKISSGGNLGGIHWGMAVDVDTIYVAATDLSVNKASSINDSVTDRLSLVDNARPGIYALDLNSGGLVWETHPTHNYQGAQTPSLYSAALSVTNDVLFAASLDGVVKAFSILTGAELWSLDTAIPVTDINGVSGNGGTIDSVGVVIAGDNLLINSGYSTFGGAGPYQAGPGNTLFIVTLPQQ